MPATTQASGLQRPPDRFPRPVLIACGALVGFSILAAGFGRLVSAPQEPANGIPIASRDLRFVDRPDGGVDVIDATTAAHVTTITGQAGFLRATVRGLASARLRAGISPPEQPAFRLTAWKDGRLTLDDLADHRHVELEAFGPSNEAVFVDLLNAPEHAEMSRTLTVECDVDIEQTPESLHAHAVPDGIDIRPGDSVLVHDTPTVPFGQRITCRCPATRHPRRPHRARLLAHHARHARTSPNSTRSVSAPPPNCKARPMNADHRRKNRPRDGRPTKAPATPSRTRC